MFAVETLCRRSLRSVNIGDRIHVNIMELEVGGNHSLLADDTGGPGEAVFTEVIKFNASMEDNGTECVGYIPSAGETFHSKLLNS